MGWEEGNNILFVYLFIYLFIYCYVGFLEGRGRGNNAIFLVFSSICNVMAYVQ